MRSRLGGALLAVAVTDPAVTSESRTAILTEAEALLLEAEEVLHQNANVELKYRLDSLERIVRLYEAWEKPGKASDWQQKLDAFQKGAG